MNIWRLMAHHLPQHYDEIIQWSAAYGLIGVGWGQSGDLRDASFRNESDITKLIAKKHENSSSNFTNGGRSLWMLYNQMQIGDLVIVKTKKFMLTMRITGDYHYSGDQYPPYYEHRRKAEVVPINPQWLWIKSGGKAAGENIYSPLIRCENKFSDQDYDQALAAIYHGSIVPIEI